MYTSIYQPPSTTTTSPYSSYLYGNGSTPSAYETTPKYSTVGPSMASSYLNDLNSFSSTDPTTTGTSSTSHRPYVSAIRKRRTLFADADLMMEPAANGTDSYSSSLANGHHHLFSNENYSSNHETTSSDNNKPNLAGFGFSHARNRPLSVVNEDAAAAAAALNNSNKNNNIRESGIVTLNRSLTFNDASFVKSNNNSKNENNNNNAGESSNGNGKPGGAANSKSGLRKSHSVNSPKSVESSKPPSAVASTSSRTTVFDRLAQGAG